MLSINIIILPYETSRFILVSITNKIYYCLIRKKKYEYVMNLKYNCIE